MMCADVLAARSVDQHPQMQVATYLLPNRQPIVGLAALLLAPGATHSHAERWVWQTSAGAGALRMW